MAYGDALLAIPLDTLEINIRAYNALKKRGIVTIGDLLAEAFDGPNGLRCIPNIGPKSANEIGAAVTERIRISLRSGRG